MTGLILCGGQSSRMGSDKGLLSDSGIIWAKIASQKLASVVSQVSISVNIHQLQSYSKHFSLPKLIVDSNDFTIGGPLLGLLSAHLVMPQEDIFLFACDLLFMEPIVFEELITLQKKSPNKEAFVYRYAKEVEPLCGIYTALGLAKILSAYQSATLGKQSMKHVLEILDTLNITLQDSWHPYFKNINSRNDM